MVVYSREKKTGRFGVVPSLGEGGRKFCYNIDRTPTPALRSRKGYLASLEQGREKERKVSSCAEQSIRKGERGARALFLSIKDRCWNELNLREGG